MAMIINVKQFLISLLIFIHDFCLYTGNSRPIDDDSIGDKTGIDLELWNQILSELTGLKSRRSKSANLDINQDSDLRLTTTIHTPVEDGTNETASVQNSSAKDALTTDLDFKNRIILSDNNSQRNFADQQHRQVIDSVLKANSSGEQKPSKLDPEKYDSDKKESSENSNETTQLVKRTSNADKSTPKSKKRAQNVKNPKPKYSPNVTVSYEPRQKKPKLTSQPEKFLFVGQDQLLVEVPSSQILHREAYWTDEPLLHEELIINNPIGNSANYGKDQFETSVRKRAPKGSKKQKVKKGKGKSKGSKKKKKNPAKKDHKKKAAAKKNNKKKKGKSGKVAKKGKKSSHKNKAKPGKHGKSAKKGNPGKHKKGANKKGKAGKKGKHGGKAKHKKGKAGKKEKKSRTDRKDNNHQLRRKHGDNHGGCKSIEKKYKKLKKSLAKLQKQLKHLKHASYKGQKVRNEGLTQGNGGLFSKNNIYSTYNYGIAGLVDGRMGGSLYYLPLSSASRKKFASGKKRSKKYRNKLKMSKKKYRLVNNGVMENNNNNFKLDGTKGEKENSFWKPFVKSLNKKFGHAKLSKYLDQDSFERTNKKGPHKSYGHDSSEIDLMAVRDRERFGKRTDVDKSKTFDGKEFSGKREKRKGNSYGYNWSTNNYIMAPVNAYYDRSGRLKCDCLPSRALDLDHWREINKHVWLGDGLKGKI